jgi:hypothetical protein
MLAASVQSLLLEVRSPRLRVGAEPLALGLDRLLFGRFLRARSVVWCPGGVEAVEQGPLPASLRSSQQGSASARSGACAIAQAPAANQETRSRRL